MKRKRIVWLDAMRVFAIVLVVLMHSPSPKAGVPGYVQAPLYFIASAGVPLFFMISGILLLPVQTNMFVFLKKRINRIVAPLIIWSLFYVILKFLEGDLNTSAFITSIFSIPFSTQGIPELWFLYPMLGIYFIAPILSCFLVSCTRKEIEFYLILWGISLCLPMIKSFLCVDEGRTGTFYYFMGYGGFFVLGYYLYRYRLTLNKLWIDLLFILVPLIIYILFRIMGWLNSLADWHFYLNIWVVIFGIGWFYIIRKLCMRFISQEQSYSVRGFKYRLLVEVSNCSFGIYLIHIFIMRHLLWKLDWVLYSFGGIGQVLITWVLTIVISFLLTYLLSYLPKAQYIIGYSQRKK